MDSSISFSQSGLSSSPCTFPSRPVSYSYLPRHSSRLPKRRQSVIAVRLDTRYPFDTNSPLAHAATVSGHDLAPPPLSYISPIAGLPPNGVANGALIGRDVAALPGDSGSGVTIIGRQLPDLIHPGGDKDVLGSRRSDGIMFKPGAFVSQQRVFNI